MATKRPEQKTKKKYLTEQLRETHKDMDCAREMDSWTAVATLRRQALALRAELDALALSEEEQRNAAGRATDDQILGEIVAAVGFGSSNEPRGVRGARARIARTVR